MVTRKSFLDGAISEAGSGVLPINLPAKRINKILDKAISTWRDNDDRATLESILFVGLSKVTSCRIIKLPEDVKAVQRLEVTSNRPSVVYSVDDRRTVQNSYDGDHSLISYLSIGAYNELLSQLGVRFVPYDFSEYTHELVLEGNPERNIFMEVARYIPEEALFKIDDFESYVASKILLDYTKINGFFQRKLVGGREIDFKGLRDDAKETISEIKKIWTEQSGNAVMLLD